MRFYVLLLLLVPLIQGLYIPEEKVYWIIQPDSNLHVYGSTNINTYQCDIVSYLSADTIGCTKAILKGQALPMSGKMDIAIESFDCHNKMMTNDLRKTLKYKENPNLTIRFISLNSFPDFKNPLKIIGIVDISLAGVTKRFDITYLFTQGSAQQIHLKGVRNINFSDFNLVAPSKMGGIIKAKDLLNVEFNLNLKAGL